MFRLSNNFPARNQHPPKRPAPEHSHGTRNRGRQQHGQNFYRDGLRRTRPEIAHGDHAPQKADLHAGRDKVPVAPAALGGRASARQLDPAQGPEDLEFAAVAQGHSESGGFWLGQGVREPAEGVHAGCGHAVVQGPGIVALYEGIFDSDRYLVRWLYFRRAVADECRFSWEVRRRPAEQDF